MKQFSGFFRASVLPSGFDATKSGFDRNSGRVLVTGATGHLGANLVRRLLADSEEIRVLIRQGPDKGALAGLDVERVYGDLRDAPAVDAAVRGCSRIYHCAALVSTINGNAAHKREIFDTNVLGTRHILLAAARHGVNKAVVSGSLSATGYEAGLPSSAFHKMIYKVVSIRHAGCGNRSGGEHGERNTACPLGVVGHP